MDLALHQGSIFQQLQAFRQKGQLCDLVVKSRDGTEHHAHAAMLCAASVYLKNMLVGPFLEAGQMRQGQPVELAASTAVVSALLEYIYGGQPQIELQDSIELLHVADAYSFPELAAAVKAGLQVFLKTAPVATTLQVLQQTPGLDELKALCEEKIAVHFEECIDLVEFLDLEVSQLGRILRRKDLSVSREEVVLKGLLKWLNSSKDRSAFSGLLSHYIDFHALSLHNLDRVRSLCAGPNGHGLQQEVDDAIRARRKRRNAADAADVFRPKRRCLQHWSPGLGASSEAPREVLPSEDAMPAMPYSLCWHKGALYIAYMEKEDGEGGSIRSWQPGDCESRTVAGVGARVNGVNDLGPRCTLSICPNGEMFAVDEEYDRLVSFQNGNGKLVLNGVGLFGVFCSPNGVVYIITENGRSVQKLVGPGASFQSVISNENLKFQTSSLSVSKDEVLYFHDACRSCIFRINPGETRPTVVAEVPSKGALGVQGLCVTEAGEIYISDCVARKVWSFTPGDSAWTEVVACPTHHCPEDVLVVGRSLYVIMCWDDYAAAGIYEYLLPSDLQLE
eukprot:Skav228191  [mRNA]  locus=scaffold3933:537411:539096:+ [translate_table: standard]